MINPRLLITSLFAAVSIYGQIATTTTLSSVVPAAPSFGQRVTLTATVTPSITAGSVAFMDGGVLVGVGNVNAGVAVTATISLSAGKHSFRAVYGGAVGYTASHSAATTYT